MAEMDEETTSPYQQQTDNLSYEDMLDKLGSAKSLPSRTLLKYLIERNASVKSAEIQRDLNMSPQSVTNIGSRLEEMGLISREKGAYKAQTGRIITILIDAIIDMKQRLDEMEVKK